MNDGLPVFRYHPDPVATGSVEQTSGECSVCGEDRGYLYVGPVYTEDDVTDGSLCPWCIADGRAASTFDAAFTDIGEYGPDDAPQSVLDEVSRRTPGFNAWQQDHWLYHCGDACAFVGLSETDGEATYLFRCLDCGEQFSYSDSA